jgi:hypothetical protein
MPNFMFAYHGGKKPDTPEEGEKSMAEWKEWLRNLGDDAINPGTPLGLATTVGLNGASKNKPMIHMSGFSIIKADSMETAIKIATDCPFVKQGTIDIAEIKEMKPQH